MSGGGATAEKVTMKKQTDLRNCLETHLVVCTFINPTKVIASAVLSSYITGRMVVQHSLTTLQSSGGGTRV